MRKTKITLAALLMMASAGFSATQAAAAEDWGQMDVASRLAWAGEYAKQVCPYGLKVSKKDEDRKSEIASAPQWGVKLWVYAHCKSGPVRASR